MGVLFFHAEIFIIDPLYDKKYKIFLIIYSLMEIIIPPAHEQSQERILSLAEFGEEKEGGRMENTCITLHYFRFDGLYDGWYLWIWPEEQPGALFEFTGQDGYGAVCSIDCRSISIRKRIGMIIKKSRDRWDQGQESARFFDLSSSRLSEIWLVEHDPAVYQSLPEIKISPLAVFADGFRQLTITLQRPVSIGEVDQEKPLSFSLHDPGVGALPIRSLQNGNPLGVKTLFEARQEGYEILDHGQVHFVFDPQAKNLHERIEGSRSLFVLGNHNNWREGEGDPRWRMTWNEKERYYELMAKNLPLDGSIHFKFKEVIDGIAKGWFPGELDPPLVLLGSQSRRLTLELGQDLDIRKDYYLSDQGDVNLRVIPRKIMTDPAFISLDQPLGVSYSPEVSIFRVFAPLASQVVVRLYADLFSPNNREVAMYPQEGGLWSCEVSSDLAGLYYTFNLSMYGRQHEVMDPYCRCACSILKGIVTKAQNRLCPDLGLFYAQKSTFFRFSFPQALTVEVLLARSFHDQNRLAVPLSKNEQGLFEGSAEGDWLPAFYTIRLTETEGIAKEIVDPWAEYLAVGPSRGRIIDLAKINEQVGWAGDQRPSFSQVTPGEVVNKPEDAIIYELHLRDFTIAPNSGIKAKGWYEGLIETGTFGPFGVKTGLDHLLELGVTHVQIMPIQNITSWLGPEEYRRIPHYHWGYMPVLFNAPECLYSTDPTNESSVIQFKQMIKGLHKAGLRVILDVVYNHYDNQAPFDQLVPYYYFRMDEFGRITNGAGTGNEMNTLYPMVRRFILDSVKFWVEEYHIDGFRFDLMGLIDLETMTSIAEEIHKLDPTLLVYGEPWSAGPSGLADLNVKGKQKGRGYGVFNDHFRNAVKGFPDREDPAFVQGASTPSIAAAICRGLRGSIEDFTKDPGEAINYVTCHDNLVMRDKLSISSPLSEEARKSMVKLAGLLFLSAQGVPFLHSGFEIYRTKLLCPNSYNQPDSLNRIDWQWKHEYLDLFRYLQGVIALRKQHPAFRLATQEEIEKRVSAIFYRPDQIVYLLDGTDLVGETWQKILVLLNGNTEQPGLFSLPQGVWQEVSLAQGSVQEGKKYNHIVSVEPIAGLVLFQKE